MSTATIPPAPALMTAAEFLKLHGDDSGVELVKGRIVRCPMPGAEHGRVCGEAYASLREFVKPRELGRLMTNDTHVYAGADPDSVRGADVCFLSYKRLPKDQPLPKGALEIPPELVIEVRSPPDRLRNMQEKVNEYLDAGVDVVVVLDPSVEIATIFRKDSDLTLSSRDELTLPDILPEFRVPVRQFFATE